MLETEMANGANQGELEDDFDQLESSNIKDEKKDGAKTLTKEQQLKAK